MAVNDTSSSGEITSSFENISDVFTAYAEIPSGGFNRLYKAKRYGKWFVLKGLKPEFQRKAVYKELLTKEFELGVQMDHPNIAHTFSFETDPVAGPCIVMEYVDGCTLKEFLAQSPSRAVRMKVAKEILSAMSYFHGKQIIHRDLKPDNILITHNGHNVKIIDFGLADTDYHGILKQPAGSDKYAAPEQKSGGVALDCRADLYAFGVILRQLFPYGYGGVVRKCTQPDREMRFGNAEEILRRLQRSQRLTVTIAILVALIFVVVGAWWFSLDSRQNQTDSMPPKTEDTVTTEFSSGIETEREDVPMLSAAQREQNNTLVVVPQEMPNSTVVPVKEATAASDMSNNQQIPQEVTNNIEQAVDTLFRRFWDWEKTAMARRMSSGEKLAEYLQSDFFKNNYEIRERHREAVVNEILRRYPQCEPNRESLVTYYNSTFVKKMVAVNNVVNGWQRDNR